MKKKINLTHKLGQGISPQQFMEGMKVRVMELSNIPNTKERFLATYKDFFWNNEEDRNFFRTLSIRKSLRCLILCTDWCPDVIWNVPVLFRVMEKSKIPTEVLLMEEHLETMDLFMINGGRAQPIALILDENGDVLGSWGARPKYIQEVMDQFKRNNLDKDDLGYEEKIGNVYQEIGELYNSGIQYQEVMLQELRQLFSSIESIYLVDRN